MSTPCSWEQIPPNVQSFVQNYFDDAWGRQHAPEGGFDAAARDRIQSSFGYSLRMYWLGRTDKLSSRALEPMAWLTAHLVPDTVLAQEQEPPYVAIGQARVMFPQANHHELERNAMTALIDAYIQGEGLAPAQPPKPALWRRLFR